MIPEMMTTLALPILINRLPYWIIYALGLWLALQGRERFPRTYRLLVAAFGIFLTLGIVDFVVFSLGQYLILSQHLSPMTYGFFITVENCGGLLINTVAWGLLLYAIFAPTNTEPGARTTEQTV